MDQRNKRFKRVRLVKKSSSGKMVNTTVIKMLGKILLEMQIMNNGGQSLHVAKLKKKKWQNKNKDCCYKCGEKGHIRKVCPKKLEHKVQIPDEELKKENLQLKQPVEMKRESTKKRIYIDDVAKKKPDVAKKKPDVAEKKPTVKKKKAVEEKKDGGAVTCVPAVKEPDKNKVIPVPDIINFSVIEDAYLTANWKMAKGQLGVTNVSSDKRRRRVRDRCCTELLLEKVNGDSDILTDRIIRTLRTMKRHELEPDDVVIEQFLDRYIKQRFVT